MYSITMLKKFLVPMMSSDHLGSMIRPSSTTMDTQSINSWLKCSIGSWQLNNWMFITWYPHCPGSPHDWSKLSKYPDILRRNQNSIWSILEIPPFSIVKLALNRIILERIKELTIQMHAKKLKQTFWIQRLTSWPSWCSWIHIMCITKSQEDLSLGWWSLLDRLQYTSPASSRELSEPCPMELSFVCSDTLQKRHFCFHTYFIGWEWRCDMLCMHLGITL